MTIVLATLATAHEASAMPGYDANVKSWCAAAGRPAPTFTADVCSTCHAGSNYGASTPQKSAYQNLRASQSAANLDPFCPAAAPPTPTPPPASTNQPPTLTLAPSGNQSVSEGQTLTISLTASDPNGDAVILSAAPSPLPGSATFQSTGGKGTFTWATGAGDAGTYSVTFTAKDQPADASKSLSTTQTISVTVLPAGTTANHAPVLDVIPSPQTGTVGQTLEFTVTASDPDDDNVTFDAPNLPAGASLTAKGLIDGKWKATVSWVPTADQANRTYTSTITARDNFSSPAQAAQEVNFVVLPAASDMSIKKIQIGQSGWVGNRSELVVKGKVNFSKRLSKSAAAISVTIYNADTAQILGSASVRRNGSWKFTGTMSESSVPCNVRADVNGVGAVRNVKRAPGACDGNVSRTKKTHDSRSSEHEDGDH